MSDPSSQPPSDLEPEPEVPRVHSQEPAEGADPDSDAEARTDAPRVHGQDPSEG